MHKTMKELFHLPRHSLNSIDYEIWINIDEEMFRVERKS